MNPYKDTMTVLITTLRQDPTIIANLTYQGFVKVLAPQVVSKIPLPYIVVSRYAGGSDNDAQSQASDMLMKVTAYTQDDLTLAETLQDAINSALHYQVPDSSALTGVGAYAAIYEQTPIEDDFVRQNINFIGRGGIYRVRLAEIIS